MPLFQECSPEATIGLGACSRSGLLDEFGDREDAVGAVQRARRAGCSRSRSPARSRRDAEGDQRPAARRGRRALDGARKRRRRSPITWSDGMTSISGSGSRLGQRQGRDAGGRRRVAADRLEQDARAARLPISRSCSAMMNRCSSLATSSGAAKPRRSATRRTVCCSRLSLAEQAAAAASGRACATSARAGSPNRRTG